jgi:hypothetical protein
MIDRIRETMCGQLLMKHRSTIGFQEGKNCQKGETISVHQEDRSWCQLSRIPQQQSSSAV